MVEPMVPASRLVVLVALLRDQEQAATRHADSAIRGGHPLPALRVRAEAYRQVREELERIIEEATGG